MASNDLSNKPKRRTVTYSSRGRPPASKLSRTLSSGASDSKRSSDRPGATASASKTTRQPGDAPERDPYALPSSPEPLSLAPPNVKATTTSTAKVSNSSERKRKVSELHSPKAIGRDPLTERDDMSPSKLPSRISRLSSPESSRPVAQPKYAPRRRVPSAPREGMDLDGRERALSSPPPTPASPKLKKPRVKATAKSADPFPPHTTKAAGDLSVAGGEKKKKPHTHQIPVRLAREKSIKSAQSSKDALVPSAASQAPAAPAVAAHISSFEPRPPKKQRKMRLVDKLKEQTEMEEDSDVDQPESQESQVGWSQPLVSGQTNQAALFDSQETQNQTASPRKPISSRPPTFSRASSQLKRTYGQQNTMLEETDLYAALEMPVETLSLKGRRLELSTHKMLAKSEFEDEDEVPGSSQKNKIQGIHELRQAGANSFVADQMLDLTDQLGTPNGQGQKPSSSRRAALRHVAEKAAEKEFRRALRDHGVEATIFSQADKEHDLVTGYLIVAILLQLLANGDSPHIVRLVRSGGMGGLFTRLLKSDGDIKRTVRDRKSNISKREQTMILALQTGLADLSTWRTKPTSVSPKTATLKCLDLLITQDAGVGGDPSVFPTAVTDELFSTLSAAQEADFWVAPDVTERVDVYHALSVLEFHAVKALQFQAEASKWLADYLPPVSDAFGAVLRSSATPDNGLEELVLRLVVNLVETIPDAAEVFVSKGLLPTLAESICSSFDKALQTISTEEWTDAVSHGLVLRLGILINCAEQSVAVRRAVHDTHDSQRSAVDGLIRLFLQNHKTTSEVSQWAPSLRMHPLTSS